MDNDGPSILDVQRWAQYALLHHVHVSRCRATTLGQDNSLSTHVYVYKKEAGGAGENNPKEDDKLPS